MPGQRHARSGDCRSSIPYSVAVVYRTLVPLWRRCLARDTPIAPPERLRQDTRKTLPDGEIVPVLLAGKIRIAWNALDLRPCSSECCRVGASTISRYEAQRAGTMCSSASTALDPWWDRRTTRALSAVSRERRHLPRSGPAGSAVHSSSMA